LALMAASVILLSPGKGAFVTARAASPSRPSAHTTIATDTTWDTNQTIGTDVVVEDGATLVVASGTVISFSDVTSDPYPDGLSDKNELIVEEGGQLIIAPGAVLTATEVSDWGGVVFLPGSGGEISGATLAFGVAGVTIIDASPDVVSNTIQYMYGPGSSVGTMAAGVIVSGTSTSLIQDNHIYDIAGLDGINRAAESGNNGTPGGSAVGIYVHGATPSLVGNTIELVSAGNGGHGGSGTMGQDGDTPGNSGTDGGDGGDGGMSGKAWGIRVEGATSTAALVDGAATSWGIYNNVIRTVSANFGGDGGRGGDGGDGADGADGTSTATDGGLGGVGGNPGDGADGNPAYGIYIQGLSPAVQGNRIDGVYGGEGGAAGWSNAGSGADGGDASGTPGRPGAGGHGGSSCTEPAAAGDAGPAYGILIEGASSADVRANVIANVTGGGGGWSTRCNVGSGGRGGTGREADGDADYGYGGDSGKVRYTSLGRSGHGGDAFGIRVLTATPTLARNTVYDVAGGRAGMTWAGAHAIAGLSDGGSAYYGEILGLDAGLGADGGNGGNAVGILTNSAVRIENNVVHDVNGGEAADGSDGGDARYARSGSNGGDGGDGGNGGSGWGILADGADAEIVNNTVVDVSLADRGGGGAGGEAKLGAPGADGFDGADGMPGRADGIFMDNDARPPTVNNIVAQMTGATGYGISSRTAQSGFALDHNLVWNWPLGNYNAGLSGGTNDIEANPAFADWANDDFYLRSTSPAIDQGTSGGVTPPADDHDAVSRSQDGDGDSAAVIDVGAYEFITGTEAFEMTSGVGSWASSDGYLSMAWGAGVVTETISLTYTPRGLLYPAYGLNFGGIGFSLASSEPLTFSPPLSLTLHYAEALLPQNVDEETLEVYRWDATTEQWEALTVIDHVVASDTLTGELDYLSDFALLGAETHAIYLPLVVRES
jgi:hypothetical protein